MDYNVAYGFTPEIRYTDNAKWAICNQLDSDRNYLWDNLIVWIHHELSDFDFKYLDPIKQKYPLGIPIDIDLPPFVRYLSGLEVYAYLGYNSNDGALEFRISIKGTGVYTGRLIPIYEIHNRVFSTKEQSLALFVKQVFEQFQESLIHGFLKYRYDEYKRNYTAPKVYAPDRVLDKLKYWRLKSKLSLRQVEERTGISNAYLSQLETGKIAKPSFDYVSRLLKLYQIKVNF